MNIFLNKNCRKGKVFKGDGKQKDLFIHVYIPKFVPLSNVSHAKW